MILVTLGGSAGEIFSKVGPFESYIKTLLRVVKNYQKWISGREPNMKKLLNSP